LSDCAHLFCKKCLSSYMNNSFLKNSGQLGCLACSLSMRERDFKTILGPDKFEKLS